MLQLLTISNMNRTDFSFFSQTPTRWGDADRLGHINNVVYLRYIESGRLDYLDRVLGIDFKPPIVQGVILADMKVSYLQQVHHPTNLEVATRVSRIGNSSFDFTANIYHQDSDVVVVKSKAVCVWFNYADNCKQPVPRAARDAILTFESIQPL